MSWTETELDAICYKVTSGGTPSTKEERYYGGEIPWLRTQEVVFNNIYDTDIKITADGLKNSAAKWIPADSVIVAMYGNSAGRVAINKIALTTNQACCNLIIDPAKADFKFIYHALAKDYETLHGLARGSAQNNLNAADVKRYKVKLPPLPVQQKVAGILSAYDDLIDNNRRRIVLLEKAARLLYEEWFVRLQFPGHEHTPVVDGVPQGWKKVSLKNICYEVKDAVQPNQIEEGAVYIGLEHMPRKSIVLQDWGQPEDVSSLKYRYLKGDILFGKIRPYFHKVGFALNSGICSTDAIVLRPTQEKYYSLLLMYVSSEAFVNEATQSSNGTKMPRANWKHLEKLDVFVAPDGLLGAFSEYIKPILLQMENAAAQSRKLQQARDLLLPRLMSGELAV